MVATRQRPVYFLRVVTTYTVTLLFVCDAYGLIDYPNDINGSPIIACSADHISLTVPTSHGPPSHIYAKGRFNDAGCNIRNGNIANFSLAGCGMSRLRQLDPKGLSFGLVVIVQLHPRFVTKVDRAYSVRCFFMETSKVVTSGLEVSMITADTITAIHAVPQCTYTLHMDSANGPLVRYAKVGDRVWHVWECPSDSYGILVHSCFVDDGQGSKIRILDENGCGEDSFVMKTPVYTMQATKAQQETQVFKFADKVSVFFNCQIKLCFREDGCEGISPPNCVDTKQQQLEVKSSSRFSDPSNGRNDSDEESHFLKSAKNRPSPPNKQQELEEQADNQTFSTAPISTTTDKASTTTRGRLPLSALSQNIVRNITTVTPAVPDQLRNRLTTSEKDSNGSTGGNYSLFGVLANTLKDALGEKEDASNEQRRNELLHGDRFSQNDSAADFVIFNETTTDSIKYSTAAKSNGSSNATTPLWSTQTPSLPNSAENESTANRPRSSLLPQQPHILFAIEEHQTSENLVLASRPADIRLDRATTPHQQLSTEAQSMVVGSTRPHLSLPQQHPGRFVDGRQLTPSKERNDDKHFDFFAEATEGLPLPDPFITSGNPSNASVEESNKTISSIPPGAKVTTIHISLNTASLPNSASIFERKSLGSTPIPGEQFEWLLGNGTDDYEVENSTTVFGPPFVEAAAAPLQGPAEDSPASEESEEAFEGPNLDRKLRDDADESRPVRNIGNLGKQGHANNAAEDALAARRKLLEDNLILDVNQEMFVLEPDNGAADINDFEHQNITESSMRYHASSARNVAEANNDQQRVCVSALGFTLILGSLSVLLLCTLGITTYVCVSRAKALRGSMAVYPSGLGPAENSSSTLVRMFGPASSASTSSGSPSPGSTLVGHQGSFYKI